MAKLDYLTQSWINHCKNQYPREFAHPVRIKSAIRNDEHLTNTVSRWQDKGQPCYISVFAFDDWRKRPQSATIDRIYIDLDHHTNPQAAIEDAIKLIEGLGEHGIVTTQYFSGKKGVAIYIDFAPAQIAPENKKDTIAAFQRVLMRKFDLKLDKDGGTVDHTVVGDINRVSRIPNTRHTSSGLFCVPVTLNELEEGIGHIRDLARKPRTDLPVTIHDNAVMPDYLSRLERQVIGDREKRRIMDGLDKLERATMPSRYGGKSKDENIATKLMDTLERTGHLSHKQRIGLVCLLDRLGWTRQEIIRLFRLNASDVGIRSGDVTRYQVDFTIDWCRRQARS